MKKWFVSLLVFVLVFIGNFAYSRVHPARTGVSYSHAKEKTSVNNYKKLALLIGINEYKVVNNLRGCLNDVADINRLLVENFQFSPRKNHDIVVLTNKNATHKNIVNTFREHLIRKATADTIVVFYFSGHGSQMKDAKNGDEVFDKLDETIVPHDSRCKNVFDIRDDELNGLFTELTKKTKHVTFILDSCHSGSGLKGFGIPRRIPVDLREPPPPKEWEISSRGIQDEEVRFENMNYVLISGCRANELAFELDFNGVRRGALTYYLAREIRKFHKQRIGVTYQDIMDQVKVNVNRENSTQHPQLEGRLLNHFVFSDKSAVPHPYILASYREGVVVLDAGLVHGLTKGSVFDVYNPGSKYLDNPNNAIAQVQLYDVADFMSKARILKLVKGQNNEDILESSCAVERVHHYEFENFPIYFLKPEDKQHYFPNQSINFLDPTKSVALIKIGQKIKTIPHFKIAKSGNEARLLLGDCQGRIKIFKNSGLEIPHSSVNSNRTDVDTQVFKHLEHWSKWHNILAIENHRSHAVRVSVNVKKGVRTTNTAETENDKISSEIKRFSHLDEVKIIVKNIGTGKCFFSILDISSDGSIVVLYPIIGDGQELLPGKSYEHQGVEVFVPQSYNKVTEIIKVIASDRQTNFKFLEMESSSIINRNSKDLNMDPLSALFHQAAFGDRVKVLRNIEYNYNWSTAVDIIEVVRK